MPRLIALIAAAIVALGAAAGCGTNIDEHAKAACKYAAAADDVTGDLSDPTVLVKKGTAEIQSYGEARKSSNAGLRQAAHGDIDTTHEQISAWCQRNLS